MPGGCAIGTRPVDLLIMALERLGATIEIDGGYVDRAARANGLEGGEIVFPKVTVGGTHTALMAASLANGTSVIENAAREPEIADVADCLNKMGAQITGAGTSRIVVEGVAKLNGARHSVLPDRIETGTYAMAVAMTGGDVMLAERAAGTAAGRRSTCWRRPALEVTATNHGHPRRAQRSRPRAGRGDDRAVPGFPDRPAGAAHGADDARAGHLAHHARRSSRTASCTCRSSPGSARASISTARRATIEGVDKLKGAPVMATDLRASVSLVIAALAAEGETMVNRVYHLDRGFERLEDKLVRCGAAIERIAG